MPKKNGGLILAAIVLALGAAGYAAVYFRLIPVGLGKPPQAAGSGKQVVRYVVAEPFQAGQRPPGPVYIAEVRGDNELNLSFEVGGVVELIGLSREKPWQDGTGVKAGTVLAQLKQDEFNNRADEARARVKVAREMYEKYKKLLADKAIAKAEFDRVEADKKVAEAQLASAEAAVKETVLHAPEDGTILSRAVSPSEVVAPGRQVLRFSNLKVMSVAVGVPDTVVDQVRIKEEVPVVFSALPGRSFRGRVSEVGVAGEDGSRLFRVKLKVPNPDGLIRSGMTASVSFTPQGKAPLGAVWVPLAALVGTPGADGKDLLAVYVIENGKARKSMVQTDDFSGNRVLVTRGLSAGAHVVVVGVGTLFDGAPVEAAPSQDYFQ